MPKHPSHILDLAKRGAEHRYQELKTEIAALEKLLSRLHYGSAVSSAIPDAIQEPTVRRHRKMTAAARKAVSERMTRYWSARRTAAAKG
jgi:trans-aconitate methyltransferase